MRRWSALVPVCLVALAVLWPAAPARADTAFTANATLTFLGNLGPSGEARYRFDYTVTNNSITPELGAFQVFFNSDPVTQLPSGDKATLVSYATPPGWEFVTVQGKNGDGQWSINWDWDYSTGLDVTPGLSLGGFSVVFDWSDPSSLPAIQAAEARNGSSHDGVTIVLPSSISGTVTGQCGNSSGGLLGITVDLFAVDALGHETMVASTATNAQGQFLFAGVGVGNYNVVIVTPLGYLADANEKATSVIESGTGYTVDFALTCQPIVAQPRTIGYWKHNVNVYTEGKGSAQESLNDMLLYIDLILMHFNQNITNPVLIYVPPSLTVSDKLRKLDQLLTVNNGATMVDRAKQQLLALLLNVVSGKIAQTQVISPNGATVTQAITYCNDLIQDGVKSNDETAKTIADRINNGQSVPSGMVPATTRVIIYSRQPSAGDEGLAFRLDAAAPNPSRGAMVSIRFALARADRVDLRLFDVSGRMVKTLATGPLGAGVHDLNWDGTNDTGMRVQPGVYFYRLMAEEGTLTRSVTLQR
jgi:hypothetical protein